MVAVNSLNVCGLLEEEPVLERDLLTTKAGCLGVGRVAVSFPSMKTAFNIVGRSLGSSCTHKSPTLTHLKNSFVLQLSRNVWSIKSNALSSFHNFHAWESFKIEIGMKHKMIETRTEIEIGNQMLLRCVAESRFF
jgi:hypothetical protein